MPGEARTLLPVLLVAATAIVVPVTAPSSPAAAATVTFSRTDYRDKTLAAVLRSG